MSTRRDAVAAASQAYELAGADLRNQTLDQEVVDSVLQDLVESLADAEGEYAGEAPVESDTQTQIAALRGAVSRLAGAVSLDETELEGEMRKMLSIIDNLIQEEDWQEKIAEIVDGWEAVQGVMDAIDDLQNIYQTAILVGLVDEQAANDVLAAIEHLIGIIPGLGDAIDAVIDTIKGVVDGVIAAGTTAAGLFAALGEGMKFLVDCAATLSHFVAATKDIYEWLKGVGSLTEDELADLVDYDSFMNTQFAESMLSIADSMHSLDDASHARKGLVFSMYRPIIFPIETITSYIPDVIQRVLKRVNLMPAHELLMAVIPVPEHQRPTGVPAASGNSIPAGVILMSVGDNFKINAQNIIGELLNSDGLRPGDLTKLQVNKCMLYWERGYGSVDIETGELTMPATWQSSEGDTDVSRITLSDTHVRRSKMCLVGYERAASEAEVYTTQAKLDVERKGLDSPFTYAMLGRNCQYYSDKFYESWTEGVPLSMMAVKRFNDGGVLAYSLDSKGAKMQRHLLRKTYLKSITPTISCTIASNALTMSTDTAFGVPDWPHATRSRTATQLYAEAKANIGAVTPAQTAFSLRMFKHPCMMTKPSPAARAHLQKYSDCYELTKSKARLHRVVH